MLESLDRFVNNFTAEFQPSSLQRSSAVQKKHLIGDPEAFENVENHGYNVQGVTDAEPFEGEETVVDDASYWEVDYGSNKRIFLNGEEEIIVFPETNDEHVTDIWEHNVQKWEEHNVPVLSELETGSVTVDGEEHHYGKAEYRENTPYFQLDEEMQERFADDFVNIALTYDFLYRDKQVSYAEQPIQWDKFLDDIQVTGPALETPGVDSNSTLYSGLDNEELEQQLQYKLSEAIYNGRDEVPQEGRIYFDGNAHPQRTVEVLTPEILSNVGIANDVVYDHEEDHLAVADYGEPGFMKEDDSDFYRADEFLEAQNSSNPRATLSD